MENMDILRSDRAVTDGVLDTFRFFCAHPHPSWGEAALVDALEARCCANGWAVRRDRWHNLLAELPPSPGLENVPLLIFQGHTDMVCAVAPGSGYRPDTDPITALVEDGVLRSDGRSSLGADNNLGNAAVLWLMEQGLPHGPIRLLFTVAEEVGLHGASKTDPAWLAGARYLINTDGFNLGRVVVSSAGGRRENFTKKLRTVPRQGDCAFRIRLSGFRGGHSGFDIHKGRANPLKLLALFLGELREEMDYELASLQGGHGFNAIPMEAEAVLAIRRDCAPPLALAAERLRAQMAPLFGRTDPNYEITLTEVLPPEQVWDQASRDNTLDLLALLYSGVFAMHHTLPGQVSASANLGQVRVNDRGEMEVSEFIRCTADLSEEMLAFQHARAARLTGFHSQAERYPGWMGDGSNPLAQAMDRVWRRQTGRPLEITAIHVGLEPSVLGAKVPSLVMVSTGPDILDAHSTQERAPIASLPPYVRLLAGTVDEICK